ncbi:MAG: FHA domain-containing protein [Victivallaceae bacterium]|nr:FHA domain-containing protein [Victivallaceae bacterium]
MKIYFINGLLKGEQVELFGKEMSIGRETDNNIVIVADGLSRYHAELIKQDNGNWLINDLGSTNGCRVNKELIEGERLLKEGDIVALGDQSFRVGRKKTKTKSKPSAIPVIQPVKETPKDKKDKTPAVKKIVFEPIPKKTAKAPGAAKKSSGPKPIIETVKNEVVVDKAKPEAEKSPLVTAKELSESAANIFGEQAKAPKADKKDFVPTAKKHLFNIMFYLILLVGVVAFVFWFLSTNKEIKKQNIVPASRNKKIPLVLYYVKTKITKGNVFRFSLLIENNIAKFTIDDLKSDRHHNETIKNIKPEFIKAMKLAIEDTGFMELQPVSRGSAVNNLDETRKMTIALSKKYNSITIQNNSAPTSFEDIEVAIEEFADGYDLLTFAMPPHELQKRAKESFAKAEEYYANRSAKAGNLLAAKRRYKITIDYLNQFSPKPKIWNIARKRYAEVESMRSKRYDELKYELERLERLTKIKEAIEVLNEMKELTPTDEPLYKRLNLKISILSQRLNARKK